MGRPKGALGKKTLAKMAVTLESIEATPVEYKPVEFIPTKELPPAPPVPAHLANHSVICVGGTTPGLIVAGKQATRNLNGYVMREVRRHNPDPMRAAPESLWVYVPKDTQETTAAFILHKYMESLKIPLDSLK
jgi:hypothetical protein